MAGLNYPEYEKIMLKQNNELLKKVGDDIVSDGFYPYYTKQKVKILFVGRESLSIEGSFIETLYKAYKDNQIGSKSLNASQFHRIMFYLAYAINNGFPEWDNIPWASEIAQKFGEDGGLSFAFINISKLSNDSDDWQKDDALINSYLARENARTVQKEQVKLLDPDIIISANIDPSLLGEVTEIDTSNKDVYIYELDNKGKKVKIFNMWHFSAPNKSDFRNYYEPLKTLLKPLMDKSEI